MNIKLAFRNASNLNELDQLIKDAKQGVSFSGQRYIYIQGFEGKTSINTLAKKVLDIIRKAKINKISYSEEELIIGERISNKITNIYKDNDKLAKNKNIFSRLLCYLRDQKKHFKNCGYGTRFHWSGDEKRYFKNIRQWTENQKNKPKDNNVPLQNLVIRCGPPITIYLGSAP